MEEDRMDTIKINGIILALIVIPIILVLIGDVFKNK